MHGILLKSVPPVKSTIFQWDSPSKPSAIMSIIPTSLRSATRGSLRSTAQWVTKNWPTCDSASKKDIELPLREITGIREFHNQPTPQHCFDISSQPRHYLHATHQERFKMGRVPKQLVATLISFSRTNMAKKVNIHIIAALMQQFENIILRNMSIQTGTKRQNYSFLDIKHATSFMDQGTSTSTVQLDKRDERAYDELRCPNVSN